MLLIECPWCGKRDEPEFAYGGEAHIALPRNTAELTDAQWAEVLFLRKNPKGLHFERWFHVHGCRRWFNAARNTATEEIVAVYQPGTAPPDSVR